MRYQNTLNWWICVGIHSLELSLSFYLINNGLGLEHEQAQDLLTKGKQNGAS